MQKFISLNMQIMLTYKCSTEKVILNNVSLASADIEGLPFICLCIKMLHDFVCFVRTIFDLQTKEMFSF